MDLKIKDVAELLKVSEKTIRRWLQSGKIPAYRLNHQYRFSRLEIQNWVLANRLQRQEERRPEPPTESGNTGHQTFSLLRAMTRGGVHHNIPGRTKAEVIRHTMQRLAERLDLDAELVSNLLLERESMMTTALNNGLAVPHTRDFLLPGGEEAIAVVYPAEPVPYDALDRQPVFCLFFLFAHNDKEHLRLLAKLAHFCGQAPLVAQLAERPTPRETLELIREWEGSQITERMPLEPVLI
ncbi:MAG: PTS sugar transporter subunit IIA [Chlamydiia bacterium]